MPPSTVTIAMMLIPRRALVSPITENEPLVVPDLVVVVACPALVEAAADGVKTAPGLEMQELAAAFAPERLEGARGLTVPLPAKLQAEAALLLAS